MSGSSAGMKTGRVNGWRCDDCLGITYAVHVDDGVTPMFLACRAESSAPGCKGRAASLMYPDTPPPSNVLALVAWEWYKPIDLCDLADSTIEHVNKGGLLLRPLSDEGRAVLAQHPDGPKAQFPPDQDLAPGDRSVTTVITPGHSANDARRIVQATRETFGSSCDVVVMAVPVGKGKPFLEGLSMALEAEGKLIERKGL